MHRQRDLRRRKGGNKDIMHRLWGHRKKEGRKKRHNAQAWEARAVKKTITNPKKKTLPTHKWRRP
jgi:hypothetical protein